MQTLAQAKSRITEKDKVFRLNKPQWAFADSPARYPAFVAGWGTGKSMCGIGKVMKLSEDYSSNLGVVFRKQFTDLRDSTIKDFQEYTGLTPNSSRDVVFRNKSTIMFRHIEEMNNIQNLNLGWFWIEQAEELESDEQFFKLWGRLRRKGVFRQGIITANTNGHNWIHKLWKVGTLEGGSLSECPTWENEKNLPEDFLDSLRLLEKTKPKVFNRFVMNSWEETDTVDVIIQPDHVRKAAERDLNIRPPVRKVVSIDVARYGDDKTVFYAMESGAGNETNVLAKEVWENRSTMETVGLAQRFAKRNGDIEVYAVDEIGVGGGVADRLEELGKSVHAVNSSRKSMSPDKFYNVRAEIYQYGADLFQAGRVQILPGDEELIEQLSWAKYKTMKSSGVYLVEAKEDIKKRYGRSPDEADAFLAGCWVLPRVSTITKHDKYHREKQMEFNPMTV